MYYIYLFFNHIYDFNKKLYNFGEFGHYLIKIFENFWKFYKFKNNFIILKVNIYSNKFYIKNSIEFLLNIKVLKINTLIKKNLKKAFIKFHII